MQTAKARKSSHCYHYTGKLKPGLNRSVGGVLHHSLTLLAPSPYFVCRYQLNPLYVLITVVVYMMKDRMKEWGKRYLQPVCVKFGFEFPDRIVKVRYPSSHASNLHD